MMCFAHFFNYFFFLVKQQVLKFMDVNDNCISALKNIISGKELQHTGTLTIMRKQKIILAIINAVHLGQLLYKPHTGWWSNKYVRHLS